MKKMKVAFEIPGLIFVQDKLLKKKKKSLFPNLLLPFLKSGKING